MSVSFTNYTAVTLALISIAGCGLLSGCGRPDAEGARDRTLTLVGKWKLVDVSSPTIDTMSASSKETVKRDMCTTTMDFKSDGTMKESMYGKLERDCTWEISGNMLLTRNIRRRQVDTMMIIEFTDKKCVLEFVSFGETIRCTMEPIR